METTNIFIDRTLTFNIYDKEGNEHKFDISGSLEGKEQNVIVGYDGSDIEFPEASIPLLIKLLESYMSSKV